jgi:hypothetical protein
MAMILTTVGMAGMLGMHDLPAAHAQSVAPSFDAGSYSIDGTDYTLIFGSGYTAGGQVTINLLDGVTGTLLESTTTSAVISPQGGVIYVSLPFPSASSGAITVQTIDTASGVMTEQSDIVAAPLSDTATGGVTE